MASLEKHFCGTTCANPEVNGNKADAAWKQVPMYKPSLWTRFIWWLKDKFGIVCYEFCFFTSSI